MAERQTKVVKEEFQHHLCLKIAEVGTRHGGPDGSLLPTSSQVLLLLLFLNIYITSKLDLSSIARRWGEDISHPPPPPTSWLGAATPAAPQFLCLVEVCLMRNNIIFQ